MSASHEQQQPTLIVNDLKTGAPGKGAIIPRPEDRHVVEGQLEMNLRTVACIVPLLTATSGTLPLHGATPLVPLVDHHQHLLSPMLAGRVFDAAQAQEPLTADRLIAQLDAAEIQRAAVLSLGYIHGSPTIRGDDEYAQVRAENDWTSQQVAQYPDRLRAFCSVNPLREYALTELDRCAKDLSLSHGLKLHLANSRVDLQNARHVEQVREVFQAANARRMPIVVHVWTGDHRVGKPYGRAEAQVFLKEVLPAAPDVPIQIAHLAGAGPGLDRGSKEALAVFAEAISTGDSRTRNVYFDVATTVTVQTSPDDATFIAARLRQIGLHRILYGSDMAIGRNPTPRQGWAAFRGMLPLTEAEFKTVAQNVAPFMR
jgi:predicted TIM-barrel fold metal-dependent hydrolase